MKLDQVSLADTPIFAELVTNAAVGMSGALELLSDEYQPPKPLFPHRPHTEAEASDFDEPAPDPEPVTESPTFKPMSDETDAEGYPAMVAVSPVKPSSSTTQGVRLIRPRALADMQHTS